MCMKVMILPVFNVGRLYVNSRTQYKVPFSTVGGCHVFDKISSILSFYMFIKIIHVRKYTISSILPFFMFSKQNSQGDTAMFFCQILSHVL